MKSRRPTRSQARLFAQLIDEFEPAVRRAFMASVTDLQAGVNWRYLIDALTAGNIDQAVAALNIDPAAWREYSSVMSEVYANAGASTIAQIRMTGIAGIGVRFRMTNPGAERWIAENVANKVVGFAAEQIQVARGVINAGYAQGQGPRNIAVDLVGRVSGGVRNGGVLGLDGPRAQRYHNVVEGMRTAEGVQGLVIEHPDGRLTMRYKVNEATAQRITKAYNEGRAVPDAERLISERQYKNALLKHRADTVAETEVGNAVMSAREESWQQAVDSGDINPVNVVKTWRHRRGASKYHRPDHLAMSGHSVGGLDTPFEFPDGARLQFAHDPSGGARHIIRCGCDTEFRVIHKVD